MVNCADCKYSYVDDLFFEWQCRKNHRVYTDNEGLLDLILSEECDDFEDDEETQCIV